MDAVRWKVVRGQAKPLRRASTSVERADGTPSFYLSVVQADREADAGDQVLAYASTYKGGWALINLVRALGKRSLAGVALRGAGEQKVWVLAALSPTRSLLVATPGGAFQAKLLARRVVQEHARCGRGGGPFSTRVGPVATTARVARAVALWARRRAECAAPSS